MPPNFTDERLHQLCLEAAAEQDPAKMLKLVEQINELLESKARPAERQGLHIHPAT